MEFNKYMKIKRIDDDENKDIFAIKEDIIYVEEKIDGANFRFYINKEGKIIFGSRGQQLTSNEGEDTNVAKNFKRCVDYIRDTIKDKDLTKYIGLIFYGEACHKHTMSYDWDKIPPFLGFDVKDINIHEYLEYEEKYRLFQNLGLTIVPLIKIVKAGEITEVTDDDVPESVYYSPISQDKQAEGIVFKNYTRQIFGKHVRDAFKEKNSETFGGRPKYNKIDDNDNSEFIFKYVTNPRIEKLIFNKIDDGEPLTMTLMGPLIRDTYLDIIEEEWREILTSNWKLDFKNLRKKIAPRVRAVLDQVITNNAIEVFKK